MAPRDAAASYQSRAVETAPGPQVLVMLYDRLAVDIDVAEFNKIVRPDVSIPGDARQVIEELVPLVEKLDTADWLKDIAAYDFLAAHLLEANLTKSQQALRECGAIVEPLRDAWRVAVAQPERANVPAHVA